MIYGMYQMLHGASRVRCYLVATTNQAGAPPGSSTFAVSTHYATADLHGFAVLGLVLLHFLGQLVLQGVHCLLQKLSLPIAMDKS